MEWKNDLPFAQRACAARLVYACAAHEKLIRKANHHHNALNFLKVAHLAFLGAANAFVTFEAM